MKFLAQWLVLQSMLAAGIVVAWISGLASKPFAGDNAPICTIILGMGVLGIACAAKQRWRDVDWLATHVVRVGLLGTVIGLILAFSIAGNANDATDVKPLISQVISGMYVSLYATLLGIGTNLWLKLNLKLLGNDTAINRIWKARYVGDLECKSAAGSKGSGSPASSSWS